MPIATSVTRTATLIPQEQELESEPDLVSINAVGHSTDITSTEHQ